MLLSDCLHVLLELGFEFGFDLVGELDEVVADRAPGHRVDLHAHTNDAMSAVMMKQPMNTQKPVLMP